MDSTVKDLFESLNHIENLNCGGCLFACFGVYKKLLSLGIRGENVVIVQFSIWGDSDIEHNKLFLSNKKKNACSSAHFGLSIDGGKTVYDSTGKIDKEMYNFSLIIPNHKITKFCETSLKTSNWNYMFQRRSGVKSIQKTLGVRMKKYYA